MGGLFGCVDCHTDVKSLAHETPPKKITCAGCHADCAGGLRPHSMHAKRAQDRRAAASECQDCHGGAHEVLAGGDPEVARESREHSRTPAAAATGRSS